MPWTWADAVELALDEARENPGIDTDKLATEIWAEMQEDNLTFDPAAGSSSACVYYVG